MVFNFNFQFPGKLQALDKLKEINLTIIDHEKCKKIPIADHFEVTDNHICTFTKIGEGMCLVSFIN